MTTEIEEQIRMQGEAERAQDSIADFSVRLYDELSVDLSKKLSPAKMIKVGFLIESLLGYCMDIVNEGPHSPHEIEDALRFALQYIEGQNLAIMKAREGLGIS